MAYGIEELVLAGAPAALFDRSKTYYQVGKGKFHSSWKCAHGRGPYSSAQVDLTVVPDAKMCTKCAEAPGQNYDLYVSKWTAEIYLEVAAAKEKAKDEAEKTAATPLATHDRATVGWSRVARLESLLSRLREPLERVGEHDRDDEFISIVLDLQDDLRHLISMARAGLRVDDLTWRRAAAASLIAGQDLPSSLADRRARAGIPTFHPWQKGPSDGAWLDGLMAMALREALEDGQPLEQAHAAARDVAVAEVTGRGGTRTRELEDVLDAILDEWATRIDDVVSGRPNEIPAGNVVVVGRGVRGGAEGRGGWRYRPLLAPAGLRVEHTQGWRMAAVVPTVVADVLLEWHTTNETGVVTASGPVEDGQVDLGTLELVLKMTAENRNLSVSDAVSVALGVMAESA